MTRCAPAHRILLWSPVPVLLAVPSKIFQSDRRLWVSSPSASAAACTFHSACSRKVAFVIPIRCPTCCEHGLATVSKPKPSHVEQVCLLEALWKPWQLQCIPHAPARVLTTEESLELRVTSTVPINHEARTNIPAVIDSSRCLFELLINPEERL